MEEQKTLILIDGHALAFRQYYALERTNMRTSDGIPTWAVYGFFKAIFDLINNKNLSADAICVAFDVSHQTFRVDKYPEYKANRAAMPDNLHCQMDLIYEGLKAFNIPVYTKDGYEADDVIGTISKRACELGHKVLILTGDQDSFQLIDKDGCLKVIIPYKGNLLEYDWDKVYEKLGVYPDQVVDYKSLRGDTSDNIPGVYGIGEKTAVELLAEYGHLKEILANRENIKKNKVRTCICENVEMAELSYFLATIVRDLDIPFEFDRTKVELPDVVEVTAFLKRLQFFSFLKNIDTILASFNKGAAVPIVNNEVAMPRSGEMQLGLFAEAVKAEINKKEFAFDGKIITDSQDFSAMVEELKTKSLIAFRVEGNMRNVLSADLFGIALAYNDDYTADDRVKPSGKDGVTKTFYIPLGHHISNQLDKKMVLDALKPVFEDNKIKKITYDAKLMYNFLRVYGISPSGIIFDPMLASYVKDPSRTHSIEVQALDNVDHVLNNASSPDNDLKINQSVINISLESALDYVSDVLATMFELSGYWTKELSEKELDLLYNIEMPLAEVLSVMEYNGVSVDVRYLNELTRNFVDLLRTIEFKVYRIAGQAFNISSPKQVAEILYDKMGLKTKKRGKNKNSTSAEVLEEFAQEHEIARLILDYRKYSKLKSTYTDALPDLINPIDNRIHTTYNQTITATGRLSSSNPNMQNIPIRTEEGNKIRKAFVTDDRENKLILSADYSQIELRLLAHVSGDKALIDAFNSGEDVHLLTASKVFEVPLSEVTKEMRYKAKAVNFGIVYGQSRFGLAKSLGISVAEAGSFIDKYFATYPKVKKYMDKMIDNVEKHGYVETMYGRKRYFAGEMNSSNALVRDFAKRAAINQPMQGSAADIVKLAMIDFYKKMKENNLKSKLIIQVHDELVVEVYKDELELVKRLVTEAMSLNQPLKVPLIIDINTGETWQE